MSILSKEGIHFPVVPVYAFRMDTLDRLEALLAEPRANWRALAAALGVKLLGNLATGLAIGIGVAAGLALAG